MPYVYIIIFIIGLILGSFASLLIPRLHKHEKGIILGRSHCPKCGHKLGAKDLVPFFSYLIGGAKCRYCKKPISFFYPFLELVMGSAFVLTAFLTGVSGVPLLVFYLFITFIFVVLTFYDFLYKEIPDEVVLPAFVISFLFIGLTNVYSFMDLLIGAAIPVTFFGLLFFGSKGKWLGGGDIRIGALMGTLLGWPGILVGLFLGYVLGAVYSIIGLIAKKLTRKSQIPFAPFLLIGTYITIFWGQRILDWYLDAL
jgi:prepilin signal peptidase PulO-like enzyme (type II secretory pathway)